VKVQLTLRCVPPDATLVQEPPVEAPGVNITLINPEPVGPTVLFINDARLSVKVTLDEVTGPALTTSKVYVRTSPTATVAKSTDLRTDKLAAFGCVTPVTVTEAVSFAGLRSAILASGELTVILLTMLPEPVAVVFKVTTGVVVFIPSGDPAV
jgi:hypothetical protein